MEKDNIATAPKKSKKKEDLDEEENLEVTHEP